MSKVFPFKLALCLLLPALVYPTISPTTNPSLCNSLSVREKAGKRGHYDDVLGTYEYDKTAVSGGNAHKYTIYRQSDGDYKFYMAGNETFPIWVVGKDVESRAGVLVAYVHTSTPINVTGRWDPNFQSVWKYWDGDGDEWKPEHNIEVQCEANEIKKKKRVPVMQYFMVVGATVLLGNALLLQARYWYTACNKRTYSKHSAAMVKTANLLATTPPPPPHSPTAASVEFQRQHDSSSANSRSCADSRFVV